MFTVVTNADELRKALKDIEAAEANGFMYCQAVFNLVSYGENISDCLIEYQDISEKAHPTDKGLNWGRRQRITERFRFEDGKLIPIKNNL